MQANSIWIGNEYAYLPNSGRSERFSLRCYRVKVVRVRQEMSHGAKRATTMVDVQFLDRDTGEIIDPSLPYHMQVARNEDETYAVRAYDFVEFWEQAESQYRHLRRKQLEQDQERERIERERREEQDRREQERLAKIVAIENYLMDLGIPRDWLRLDTYSRSVVIPIDKIEQAIMEKGTVAHEPSTF